MQSRIREQGPLTLYIRLYRLFVSAVTEMPVVSSPTVLAAASSAQPMVGVGFTVLTAILAIGYLQ